MRGAISFQQALRGVGRKVAGLRETALATGGRGIIAELHGGGHQGGGAFVFPGQLGDLPACLFKGLKPRHLADAGDRRGGGLLPDFRGEITRHGEQHPALVSTIIGQQHVRHFHAVGRCHHGGVAGGLAVAIEPFRDDSAGAGDGFRLGDVPGILPHAGRRVGQRASREAHGGKVAGARRFHVGAAIDFHRRPQHGVEAVEGEELAAAV